MTTLSERNTLFRCPSCHQPQGGAEQIASGVTGEEVLANLERQVSAWVKVHAQQVVRIRRLEEKLEALKAEAADIDAVNALNTLLLQPVL